MVKLYCINKPRYCIALNSSCFYSFIMRICDAHDLSRFMPDPFSGVIEFEEPISDRIREALYALGHNIQPASKPIGGSLAILLIGIQIS